MIRALVTTSLILAGCIAYVVIARVAAIDEESERIRNLYRAAAAERTKRVRTVILSQDDRRVIGDGAWPMHPQSALVRDIGVRAV